MQAPASFPQGPDSELARLVLETKAQVRVIYFAFLPSFLPSFLGHAVLCCAGVTLHPRALCGTQACVDVVRRQQHNDTPVGDMQAEFKEVFMRHFPDDDDDATSADYRKELGVVLRPTSSSEEFSQVISRFNLDQYRREITQLLQQVLNHLGHGYLTQVGPSRVCATGRSLCCLDVWTLPVVVRSHHRCPVWPCLTAILGTLEKRPPQRRHQA